MKWTLLLAIVTLLMTTACSSDNKKKKDAKATTAKATDNDADFVVDADDDDDEFADEDSDEVGGDKGSPKVASSSPTTSSASTPAASESTPTTASSSTPAPVASTAAASNSPTPVGMTEEKGQYTVEKGETLMMISFKLYGDYRKWKSIKELNPQLSGTNIKQGTKINYYVPQEKFTWNPKGAAYLIQGGDTLGKISKNKYGVTKRWKEIYENNRPLILDPNLIFAGFTLYYVPDERGVASK